MKNALILVVLILSVFSINKANSAILLEPYLGLHPFASEAEAGSNSADLSGMAYGARVGWQQMGLMLGVNYKSGSFDSDDKNQVRDIDSYSHTGAFIGYNFPIMVRVWAEYIFSSAAETDLGFEVEKGTGSTIGFGYTGFPFISINLEMTKTKDYQDTNGNDNSIEFSTTMLSVSLPFTF